MGRRKTISNESSACRTKLSESIKATSTSKKAETPNFISQEKKTPQLKSMLQLVHDNEFRSPLLEKAGWPNRWTSDLDSDGVPTWTTENHQQFSTDGSNPTARLRYRHWVPTSSDWEYLKEGELPPDYKDYNPQLITDFIGYNFLHRCRTRPLPYRHTTNNNRQSRQLWHELGRRPRGRVRTDCRKRFG